MSWDKLEDLINKYISDRYSPEERELLQEILKSPEGVQQLNNLMDEQLAGSSVAEGDYPEAVSRIVSVISEQIAGEKKLVYINRRRVLRRWSVAASLLILVSVTVLFLTNNHSGKAPAGHIANSPAEDIEPGKEGAVLTLVDGSTIVLDSLGNGLVTTQNGTKVVLKNGQLLYDAENGPVSAVGYNTMATPRGRQFQLILPDGSKVWLNAASSIRYPTVFANSERKVEITGEVYFEVAKNDQMPFRVVSDGGTEIEVLGTHFNVNSYSNEASVNTTLLEGSVRLISQGQNVVLKPGQQALTIDKKGVRTGSAQTTGIRVLSNVNVQKVMAWKNGLFYFQDAKLEEVMRQLERWYDIEVVYEKGVPQIEFFGRMGRDLTLTNVLRGLEMSEVNFRIEEGRKLVVLP